jgi:hypothetical protein
MSAFGKGDGVRLRGYLIATILSFGSLQLCARLPPRFGNGNPYHLAWLVVFISAWYLGLGPSVLALTVESLGVWYFFSPNPHSFHLVTRGSATDLGGFLLLSSMGVVFGEANRRTNADWVAAEGKIVARKRAARELHAINEALLASAEPEPLCVSELREALLQGVTEGVTTIGFDLDPLQPFPARQAAAASQFERDLVAVCSELPGDGLKESRNTSPIFRPLEPEEVGLESAVPRYVGGFSQRTGIPATAYVRPDFGRLPVDVEKALFRVIQECLTNIHWHSGRATARVRLAKHDGMVTLEVEDDHKAIPLGAGPLPSGAPEAVSAVMVGLRERVRQLGGTLQVDASRNGTIVRAVLPYAKSAAQRAS